MNKPLILTRNLFMGLLLTSFIACNSSSTEKETDAHDHDHMVMSDSTTKTDVKGPVSIQQSAVAELKGTYEDTTVSGSAKFTTESDGRVKMILNIEVPSKANKSVAVHIHENGECGDHGNAAGGHWNPTNEQHGKWGDAHFHRGDIGNVKLDANGKGTLELTTDLWQLGGDETKNILGRSIIVHGGVDDFVSQPSGNAGTRIGCGVIK